MTFKPVVSELETLRFLSDKYPTEITQLQLLSGGEWSQAYSFVSGQKKYVLRWSTTSTNFERDAYSSVFSTQHLPIPKILELGQHSGVYFAISEFAPGTFLETLSATELNTTLPALFDVFDALRTADLSQTTGYGLWDKNGQGEYASWKEYLLKKGYVVTSYTLA